MTRWILALLWIAGAFLAGGAFGYGVLDAMGLWGLPGAGFLAALGVVLAAYFAAPRRKPEFAVLCFLLGAALAWRLVGHEDYPEWYEGKAYQRTLLPFAATCAGGLLGLAVVGAIELLRRSNSGVDREAESGSGTVTPGATDPSG